MDCLSDVGADSEKSPNMEATNQSDSGIHRVTGYLTTAVSVCMIISVIYYTYFGLLLFFQVSLGEILHTCVCGVSNIIAQRGVEIVHVLIWCISALPLASVVIGLDFRMLTSFFRNIMNFLSLSKMRSYVFHLFEIRENSRIPHALRIVYGLCVCALMILCLCGAITQSLEDYMIPQLILILAQDLIVLQPIIAIIKTIMKSWSVLFPARELKYEADYSYSNEEPSEASVHEHHCSLCDPCRIRNTKEWIIFLESDCNCLVSLKAGKIDGLVVSGIVTLLFHITYHIMDIILTVQSGCPRYGATIGFRLGWSPVAMLVVRSIGSIAAVPLVMTLNPGILFFRKEKIKKHKYVRNMMISVTALHVFFILVFAASAIYISYFFEPVVINEYIPAEGNTTTSIFRDSEVSLPSLCSVRIGNFSLVDFAAANVLASIRNESARHNVSLDILPYFGTSVSGEYLSSDMFSMYRISDVGNNHNIIGFESTITRPHVGFLIEQITHYWFRRGLASVIPLYERFEGTGIDYGATASSTWWSAIMIYQYISEFFVGRKYVSVLVNEQLDHQREFANANVTHWTGHSSGALVAKYHFMDQASATSVAFESPRSEFYLMSEDSRHHLINVYSPGSFFSLEEAAASMNIEIPSAQSYLNPSNPYETFCQIAAGCVGDTRYDHLCSAFVGSETYESYFTKWSRKRLSLAR